MKSFDGSMSKWIIMGMPNHLRDEMQSYINTRTSASGQYLPGVALLAWYLEKVIGIAAVTSGLKPEKTEFEFCLPFGEINPSMWVKELRKINRLLQEDKPTPESTYDIALAACTNIVQVARGIIEPNIAAIYNTFKENEYANPLKRMQRLHALMELLVE